MVGNRLQDDKIRVPILAPLLINVMDNRSAWKWMAKHGLDDSAAFVSVYEYSTFPVRMIESS